MTSFSYYTVSQAKMPFARRFCSDSSEQLEEVYQRKMTDPIIERLVLLLFSPAIQCPMKMEATNFLFMESLALNRLLFHASLDFWI
jgi:hypothetical protein